MEMMMMMMINGDDDDDGSFFMEMMYMKHVSCRLIEGKFLIKCMHILHAKFKNFGKKMY